MSLLSVMKDKAYQSVLCIDIALTIFSLSAYNLIILVVVMGFLDLILWEVCIVAGPLE